MLHDNFLPCGPHVEQVIWGKNKGQNAQGVQNNPLKEEL